MLAKTAILRMANPLTMEIRYDTLMRTQLSALLYKFVMIIRWEESFTNYF